MRKRLLLVFLEVLIGLSAGARSQVSLLHRGRDLKMGEQIAAEEYRRNMKVYPLEPEDQTLFDPIRFGVVIPGKECVTTNGAGKILKRKMPTRYSLAPITNLLAKVKSEKGARVSLGKGEYCFGCIMSILEIEEPSLPPGAVIVYVHVGGLIIWYPPNKDDLVRYEEYVADELLYPYSRGSGGAAGPGWYRYGFYSFTPDD